MAVVVLSKEQREVNELLWNAASIGDLNEVKKCRGMMDRAADDPIKAKNLPAADPNWKHPTPPEPHTGRKYQFTAVHIAADGNHKEVCQWLLEKGGADIDAKAAYGDSPLEHVDGKKGAEQTLAYLKMRKRMLQVLAAQRFASMQKKPAKAA